MKNPSYPKVKETEDQEINLKQLFEQYAFYWKWFIVSVIVCLLIAFVYLRYAERIYNVNAKILLQDEKQASGDLAGLTELSDLTGMGSSSGAFVNDQMEILRSRRLIRNVVETNRLNISYFAKGNIKAAEMLESQSPLKMMLLEPNHARLDSVSYTFTVTKQGNAYKIKDGREGTRDYTLGSRLETPIGAISLMSQGNKELVGELQISYKPTETVVDDLQAGVQETPGKDKQSFLVNFSMNHPLVAKAELIINSLIEQYNQDVTYDKAQVTRATSAFINSRLDLISKDLAEADSKVADFKDRNSLMDMQAEAQLYMQNATENEQKLVEYQTQLSLADMMREATTGDTFNLLPSNIGLTDPSIQANINSYNELVLERGDLLKSATPDNPVVQQLNSNIAQVNKTLQVSLDNYRKVLQGNVNALQSQKSKFEGRLGQLPDQERGFKDISRQQQTVETLYLFLLQKREETEIKAAATPAKLKRVDAGYGAKISVAPKEAIIILGALVAGFLIPFAILYLKFLLDNKIHSRKDIEEALHAPILGEIPASDHPIIEENDR